MELSTSSSERSQVHGVYDGWEQPSFNHKQHIDHLLGVGLELLDLDIALVSRIDGQKYIVEHCVGGEIPIGEEFRLKITYCSLTIQQRDTFSIHDVQVSDYLDHPCFQEFKLTRYIGIPTYSNGRLYGTVNFSSTEPRQTPFDNTQKAAVKLIGDSINMSLLAQGTKT